MAKPKVSLENYQEVYDWYEQYRQPQAVTKLAYAALDRMYKPAVHFAPGAQHERDELRSYGTPQIFVFNHLTNTVDQFVASAIAHQVVPEDVGNTRVLAKDEMFHSLKPGHKVVNKAARNFVDMMGAVPVFRKKNYSQISGTVDLGQDDVSYELQIQHDRVDAASAAMLASTGNMVAAGQNLAVFAEGSYNKVDPQVVQKLRPGFARTALHAIAQGRQEVAITPIGMSFGAKLGELNPKKAVAVVGPSLFISSSEAEELIMDATAASLQDAVTVANEVREALYPDSQE